MTYNPLTYLLIFTSIIFLLYFVFRPGKGFFYQFVKFIKFNDRIILEDVLKFLYNSNIDSIFCSLDSIKDNLSYSHSKLELTIDNMLKNDLIVADNNEIKLSTSGFEYAVRIIRAHRLWERYLSEKTGYDSTHWHSKAEEKEHELDKETTDNLSSLLGNPIYDPHGKPIPSSSGRIEFLKGINLTKLQANCFARIINIDDEPRVVYEQIVAEDIHIGSIVRIIESSENRIVFHSENQEFILSHSIAENITVAILDNSNHDEGIARLSSLKINEKAIIQGLSKESRGDSRRRLLDLGFVKGAIIEIKLENPLGDPTCYYVKGTSIALRKNQASKILIKIITDE